MEKNPFTLKLLPTKYEVLETAGHNMVSDFLTNDCYILVYFGITLLFLQRETNLVAYLQLPSYNVVYWEIDTDIPWLDFHNWIWRTIKSINLLDFDMGGDLQKYLLTFLLCVWEDPLLSCTFFYHTL